MAILKGRWKRLPLFDDYRRKLLVVLSIFNATVNTLYLVRFFGVLPPEEVVDGYVPWFMSFALPNAFFSLLSWLLVYTLLKKHDKFAVTVGLLSAGGLIFHALNGFMFSFYSGSLSELTTFNAVFEVAVYVYGLSLATFYIIQFRKVITQKVNYRVRYEKRNEQNSSQRREESLFAMSDLAKEYGEGDTKVVALKNVELTIPKGKFVVILGASGSGKSTMLNMLGCMDKVTSGQIKFMGIDTTAFNKREMTTFRSKYIGFIFQSYNLLPDLTALENVEFSTELAKLTRAEAENALRLVGLSDRMNHYPAELSGGEQQRVSIARAIANNPPVLLCDEPTGALDFNTGIMVLEVLKQIHREKETSILLITHNQEIAKIADIVITMRSGEILSVSENELPLSPAEVTW